MIKLTNEVSFFPITAVAFTKSTELKKQTGSPSPPTSLRHDTIPTPAHTASIGGTGTSAETSPHAAAAAHAAAHASMATTASGELSGFHHLHHADQYYIHDVAYQHHHHHHAFQPPSVSAYHDVMPQSSASAANYFNNSNAAADQRHAVTPSPPEHHGSTNFDIKNMGLISTGSSEEKKSPSSNFYLPPIGYALSRRGDKGAGGRQKNDHASEAHKVNDFGCKLPRNKLIESKMTSSPGAAATTSSAAAARDYQVKHEDNNTTSLYRNLAQQFTLREPPPSDEQLLHSNHMVGGGGGHDPATTAASIDLFFRSEASQSSSCDIARSNEAMSTASVAPVDAEVPSYTTLTPLQSLPATISSGGGGGGIGGGGGGGQVSAVPHHHQNNYLLPPDMSPSCGQMGGMGHALPPLSNRMHLLNGFQRSTNNMMSSSAVVSDVAAAVASFSPYTKAASGGQQPYPMEPLSFAAHAPHQVSDFQAAAAHPIFQAPHHHRFVPPQYQPATYDLASSLHHTATASAVATSSSVPRGRSSRPHKSVSEAKVSGHHNKSLVVAGGGGGCMELVERNSSGGAHNNIEEVNTKAVAAKVTAELKRYSIPQAVFAQKILHRSQGTLSDLLRNPKPWSKLKSGRETFRRMFKWLQIPEETRMPDLRLAGENGFLSFYF